MTEKQARVWDGVAIYDKRKKDIVRIPPETFFALAMRGAFQKKWFKVIKVKISTEEL